MIKLIASDLDGTLLYGRDNSVSEEMFELIREMKSRGILFAAASGRQYHNMKKLFAPVWQDMVFIGENGAVVFYQDKLLTQYQAPQGELMKQARMVDADPLAEVALSSATTTYVRPKTQEYVDYLIRMGNHVQIVKEWDEVKEPCIKVAWYEKDGVEDRLEYWKDKITPPAKVVTSGTEWLDILYPDCHKGVGMRFLQEYFGIRKEEIVAFGDNDNDLEMLKEVGYPIAMKTGKEAVVKSCPYHTERVEDTIRQILDGTFETKLG